jgi:2-oxoglutarate/2-oxoacid ferredoxin oxidoreductase subunit alpha
MTSSSSPGFSLMQEGLSYIAASQVPCFVVNVMRGGPGLGNLAPTQADYFQMTRGGGHGDYHPIVLAPATVQEAVDLTYGAFDLAETYRAIVILAIDGNIGQMMEPVEMPEMRALQKTDRGWETTGAVGRPRRINTSLFLQPAELEHMNSSLSAKDAAIRANEARYKELYCDDAELIVVAFGSAARIAQTAIKQVRQSGMRVGLFRPISLYPFPAQRLAELSLRTHEFLTVEMSAGQMVEDVRLAVTRPHTHAARTNGVRTCEVERNANVHLFGKMGGLVPMPEEIVAQIEAYRNAAHYLPHAFAEADNWHPELEVAYTN